MLYFCGEMMYYFIVKSILKGERSMAKFSLKDTIGAVVGYVKTHWNTPAEGEYMTLKEVTAYTATQAGSYIYLSVSGMIAFSATYFCGYIMGIANEEFAIINIVTTILGYVTLFLNPLTMLMYENHGRLTKKMTVIANIAFIVQIIGGIGCYFIPSDTFEDIITGLPQLVGNWLLVGGVTNYLNWFIRRFFCAKYGRLKPFIVICAIPSAILTSIIPYLPLENADFTTKLVVLHFFFTLMTWFYNNFVGVNGLVTFMTPNSQERQKLHSIVPIFTGFFSSVISMFLPMLTVKTGGSTDIRTYRIFVPIFTIFGAIITVVAALKCKERVIEAPVERRKKVTFFKGAKNAFKNKYLWMVNISNIFGQWCWLVGNLLSWWFVYSLRAEWISGVAANIVNVSITAGNILCPILTRKFQKRNILISSRMLTLVPLIGVAFAVKTGNIVLFIVSVFIRNGIQPIVDGVGLGLTADIQEYHQWRFGERCDNISSVFSWFLNPVSAGIGYVMPWILEKYGFTSDWDVLFDSEILSNVFNVYTIGTAVGIVLVTVPYIFYDLTHEKHAKCVAELQERLRVEEDSAIMEGEKAI